MLLSLNTRMDRLIAFLLTVILVVGLLAPATPKTDAATTYEDVTYEFTQNFIAECLARLGRGYVTGGGHGKSGLTSGQYFDCTGLVVHSLKTLGLPCPGLQQDPDWDWDVWGATTDWRNWFASKSNGEVVG